ncbi:beta-ketoacyl-[acyl-carrier-protein] synthase family protein [Bacteroidota bacterium]
MSRVVITSAGVVSPLGSSVEAFMRNLESGNKGIKNIENFNTEFFPTRFGAEAKEDNKVLLFEQSADRKEKFINHAVDELLQKSNIAGYNPKNRSLHLGAGIDYFDLVSYVDNQSYKIRDWDMHCKRSNNVVNSIALKYNIRGGHSTNVSACVASTQSIGLSFRILKQNPEMAIITGGFDSMLCHLHYLGFYKLGALSNWEGEPGEACRPFDKNRCGLVIGEGGVAFFLQNDEIADKNNILAEIVGYASTMDSYMVTDPHPEGKYLARAAFTAIKEAGITPEDIDCVHAHGTGTFRNGLAEAKAMQLIFGEQFSKIPVFSLKGQIGHLIGACGAMEILGVIDSLKNQRILPTVNFNDPDTDVPLNVIKNKPLELDIKYILKLNASFGGQNTALVLKKYE